MFVKIENYKKPDVCELIDINDIRSVKVDSLITEPNQPTDEGTVINDKYLSNLKNSIIDKFDFMDENLVRQLLGITHESKMRTCMMAQYALEAVDDFVPSYRLYRFYMEQLIEYMDEVAKFNRIKSLTPDDDPNHIYTVILKSTSAPMYTTKATFDNLTKVLCNPGVDTNVRDDN
jgi:hypothetical protein